MATILNRLSHEKNGKKLELVREHVHRREKKSYERGKGCAALLPVVLRIRIRLFTLMWIRILPFRGTLMRIRIPLSTLMRIRIQLPKVMRIHADPDPKYWLTVIGGICERK
jgi:hypothetical protein